IGAAAANIAVHGCFNLLVSGVCILVEQGRGRHDLSGLAIPALWHIHFQPGFLHRMVSILGESFYGGDLLIAYRRYGQRTGARRRTIYMNSTGPALRYAAAILGSY